MKQNDLNFAAKILQDWGVVAFPTETVYGLWANIYDKQAIQKIFTIKWRASDNPLIVHISDISELPNVAIDIPEIAYELWKKFWPGPLTFVLKKQQNVVSEVSAGWDTIGIRVPNHPIARELIALSWVPLAAPSANLSWKPSPTSAQHVHNDLSQRVDYIVDGGEANIWVESTVIDLTVQPPVLLRPGGISFEQLKEVLPNIEIHPHLLWQKSEKIVKSPGMKYRHYAPETTLYLFSPEQDDIIAKIQDHHAQWKKIWIIGSKEMQYKYLWADRFFLLWSRENLEEVSHNLFATLRQIDIYWLDSVYCETFETKWIWLAIMDRLKRACEK